MGLVAAGGQSSEIALKSASPGSEWCFQHLPAATNASATGVRTLHSGSINNSIFICPSPTSPVTPRVLVSSNDEVINVYEVAGTPPNYRAAKRRRERQRRAGWSVVEATWAAERGDPVCAPDQSARGRRRSFSSDDEGGEDDVEEQPSYEQGQSCHLVPKPHETIRLNTAVNHCSVSPDGKWLIAVGDTNEVFLYSAPRAENDQYELAHTFTASSDASFSTDWNQDNQTFAVASQDGFVHVFDIRSLPSCSRPASPTLRAASSSPRKVAELKTTQSGPAGAARKVKFSPGGRKLDGGLLAFTEVSAHLEVSALSSRLTPYRGPTSTEIASTSSMRATLRRTKSSTCRSSPLSQSTARQILARPRHGHPITSRRIRPLCVLDRSRRPGRSAPYPDRPCLASLRPPSRLSLPSTP